MRQARPETVSNAEALKSIQGRIEGADEARRDRLEALERLSASRRIALRRELLRLAEKHGDGHPLAREAEARARAVTLRVSSLRAELDRARLSPPAPKDDAWTVFGIVRDQQGEPVRDVVVVLVDERGAVAAPDRPVPTGRDGAFEIAVPMPKRRGRRADPEAEDKEKGKEKEKEKERAEGLRLAVVKGRETLATDTVVLRPLAGAVDYRELSIGPAEDREARSPQ